MNNFCTTVFWTLFEKTKLQSEEDEVTILQLLTFLIFYFQLILKAHDTNVEIITTGDFMNRFCGTLGLARDIQRAATTIAKRYKSR